MLKLDKSISASPGVAAGRTTGRVDWVDLARGIGILLVIVGHACGGIIDSSAGSRAPAAHVIYLGIYSFHMALFFLLSGLFVAARLKSNARGFLAGTGTRIGRAYFTWAAIQFTIIYLMGSALNHPADGPYLPQLAAIVWKPVSQFWFLYVLAFMQVFAFLIVPRLGATGFFLVTAALTAVHHTTDLWKLVNWPTFNQFATYFVWFGTGVAIGPHLSRLAVLQSARWWYAVAAFVVWAGLFYMDFRHFDALNQPGGIVSLDGARLYQISFHRYLLPTAFAGTAMVILACAAGLVPWRAYVDYLGRHSMAIFLTHVLFIAGTRIVVLKLVPSIEPMLLTVVIALAGLFGSLLFLHAAKQLKIDKALALT